MTKWIFSAMCFRFRSTGKRSQNCRGAKFQLAKIIGLHTAPDAVDTSAHNAHGQAIPPIDFHPGWIHFHFETIRRLDHLHARGHYHREQLEAIAAECCELFGESPDSDSYAADAARSIALVGLEVNSAIEMAATHADGGDNASV
jgi:hypothetical protein